MINQLPGVPYAGQQPLRFKPTANLVDMLASGNETRREFIIVETEFVPSQHLKDPFRQRHLTSLPSSDHIKCVSTRPSQPTCDRAIKLKGLAEPVTSPRRCIFLGFPVWTVLSSSNSWRVMDCDVGVP